ncbi:amidophosphoribosyltransferase [Coxiella endosymbiont of Amblyomma nuttalli]|uniref:amidophosphoribosyltransferase n=1 Tax=Coxiella endosymbiont of Amblyomma nuttalli TaxID=2749996 RepID=UPI001BABF3FD|nr:amidophosphoribosyltransferase [Coxiella endosymbiont of Amblyomma nuttalli]QTS84090.1 Amidophosphoribosyltransferase [Coxiella endosymbiont of Amblyomma nuttalli]
MCGIVGMFTSGVVNQALCDALTILQHRGQHAAGIITSDGEQVFLRKANGLVRDAIRPFHMLHLRGNIGIGHVRYPTAGSESSSESQPFYVNYPYGLSLVHNGNLVDVKNLMNDLIRTDLRHLNTTSDSEILLNVVAHELQRVGGIELTPRQLFKAMSKVYKRVQGAFAAVILITGYGLLGFRDPHAIRPLVYGKRENGNGFEYMFASESIALDVLGFKLIDDVGPGEVIYFDFNGNMHRQQCAKPISYSPCIFEYIYLARPDSIMDGISIYQARAGMGISLAKKILRERPNHDIDVVIPIPDTSRNAAHALAHSLKAPYSEGFVKNRYIGRTFIMPEQAMRRSSVRLKLSAIKSEFVNKTVLLVDDSVVRGTTSKEIIQMARNAGAKKVYFASAAPPIRYPNVYGIDMPVAAELIAHDKSEEDIIRLIGADWLIYQNLKDVYEAINNATMVPNKSKIERFEDCVFTGNYIVGNITKEYLDELAELRNDAAKAKQRALDEVEIVNELLL